MTDFCFSQVLDVITKLNEQKQQYNGELFNLVLSSANLLISVANAGNKQISSFVNKMFKMADGFLTDFNARLPPSAPPHEKLNRNFINKSFDAFKKKKESAQDEVKKTTARQSQVVE